MFLPTSAAVVKPRNLRSSSHSSQRLQMQGKANRRCGRRLSTAVHQTQQLGRIARKLQFRAPAQSRQLRRHLASVPIRLQFDDRPALPQPIHRIANRQITLGRASASPRVHDEHFVAEALALLRSGEFQRQVDELSHRFDPVLSAPGRANSLDKSRHVQHGHSPLLLAQHRPTLAQNPIPVSHQHIQFRPNAERAEDQCATTISCNRNRRQQMQPPPAQASAPAATTRPSQHTAADRPSAAAAPSFSIAAATDSAPPFPSDHRRAKIAPPGDTIRSAHPIARTPSPTMKCCVAPPPRRTAERIRLSDPPAAQRSASQIAPETARSPAAARPLRTATPPPPRAEPDVALEMVEPIGRRSRFAAPLR